MLFYHSTFQKHLKLTKQYIIGEVCLFVDESLPMLRRYHNNSLSFVLFKIMIDLINVLSHECVILNLNSFFLFVNFKFHNE